MEQREKCGHLAVCRFFRWTGTMWQDGQGKVAHCLGPNGKEQKRSVSVITITA